MHNALCIIFSFLHSYIPTFFSTFAFEMKKFARYICVLLLLIGSIPAWAQRPGVMPDSLPAKAQADENDEWDNGINLYIDSLIPWEESLRLQLDKLMEHSLLETSQIGLMVWDLDADSCLYKRGERQRLRPASTLKVLTAITALDCLGADYRFATELRSKGEVTENADSTRTFRGNLYCIGGLDPKFGKNDMQTFVSAVTAMKVDSIIGTIYADLSFKDDKLLGEGWCWDDDNPSLSPLLLGRKNVFKETFHSQLREGKTVLWANSTEGAAPKGTELLCRVEHTMDDILGPMLKKSDNLYAEAMFYQIAHRRKGSGASASDGRNQIYETMRKAGLTTAPYYIADGSGLSLYTYVTAQAETMMLRYAYGKPEIYEPLYRALPIAGVDGTLASRMKGSATKSNVRAKTGTVTGVSSLAGYCRGGNGHQFCFSIINQGIKSSSDGRNFQDAICALLCR